MRLKKYLSGYRRPNLTHRYSDPHHPTRQALAYQMYLLGREAPHVGSESYRSSGGVWREWIEENKTHEFQDRLARQSEQQVEIERRAYAACKRASELLSWYGFGAAIQQGMYFGEPTIWREHGYYTDGKRYVFIGTRRARGYTSQQRKPLQIIIEPGRDPDDSEIVAMIETTLGVQLPFNELFHTQALITTTL